MPFFAALSSASWHRLPTDCSGRASVAGAMDGGDGLTAAVSVGRALVRDPLLEPRCWRDSGDDAFLVDADPGLARTLDDHLAGGGARAQNPGDHDLRAAAAPEDRIRAPSPIPLLRSGVVRRRRGGLRASVAAHPARGSEDHGLLIDLPSALAPSMHGSGCASPPRTPRAPRARRFSPLAPELGDARAPGRLRTTLAAVAATPG